MNPPSTASYVWLHFERMENAGKCLYCSQIIRHTRNSTFSLKRHLASKHMAIHRAQTQDSIRSGRDGEYCMQQESPTTVPSRSATKEHIPSRTIKLLSVDTKDTLDDYLLQFITQECLSFSTVDSEALKQFCNALNPNYVIPSSSIITEAILKRKYVKSLQRVKDTLANTAQVALTLDEWTNIDATSFYALTAHYIDHNYKLCTSLLECSEFSVSHTELNIAQWISKVIDDFNVPTNNVAVIVTDNRPHMLAVVRYLNLKHFPCFARTLNSIVIKAVTDTIGDTIEKVKKTIAHLQENSTASSKLAEAQSQLNLSPLKLKLDLPSRWTSTYVMIERFHQNKVALLECLDSIQMQNALQSKDWLVMEQTLKVLHNVDSATKIASSEKNLMLSHVGLMVNILKKKTSVLLSGDLEDSVHNLARSLIKDLSAIYDPTSAGSIVNQCMLLDPRMKRHSFENENEKCVQTQKNIIELCVPFLETSDTVPDVTIPSSDPYRDHFFSDFVNMVVDVAERETSCPRIKAQRELDEYITAPCIALTADPLLWWKQNEARFPSLCTLVKHMFCIPASSIPCERVFTKAGQIYEEKRARLNPKHVPEMLFVQQNGF